MHDSLWYILGLIALASWCLYAFETLPKIRKRRTIYLSDWGFSPFKPLKNLNEYKNICEQENKSLIWYRAQLYLILAFMGIGILWILIPLKK